MFRARRISRLSVLLMTVASYGLLRAQTQQLSPRYVRDLANVLDPASKESIDELSYRLEHWTGAQMDIVTVRSLGPNTSRKSALNLFDESDRYPVRGNDRLVVLFVLNNDRFIIVAGPRLQSILSHRIRAYEKETHPYLEHHQYASAIALLAERIAEAIANDAHVGLRPVNDSAPLGTWAPVAQPHDVLVRCLGIMVLFWTITIPLLLIARAIRARHPRTRALLTPLGITRLQN